VFGPRRDGRGGGGAGRIHRLLAGCGAAGGWSLPRPCGSMARLRRRLREPAGGGRRHRHPRTVLAVPGDEATVERASRTNFLWRGLGCRAWNGLAGGEAVRQGWRKACAAILAAVAHRVRRRVCRGCGSTEVRPGD